MQRFIGAGLILISAASFGTLAIFGRYAYASGLDTFTLLAIRFSAAALLMALLLFIRRQSERIPTREAPRTHALQWRSPHRHPRSQLVPARAAVALKRDGLFQPAGEIEDELPGGATAAGGARARPEERFAFEFGVLDR